MRNAQKTEKELVQELNAARRRLTEQERIKEELRLSEEKFASIFRYNPMALSLTRLKDGKIIEINDSYTAFSGYTRDELIGRKISELNIWVNPEDRERMLKIMREKGRVSNEEFDFHVKSGEVHSLLVSVEKVNVRGEECLILMTLDITARKQAEEQLKESEEFNSTLLINTPNAIFVTYSDGAIKYVNPAFEKLTGFSLAGIIGMKPPYPWWPKDKMDEMEANLKETVPGEGIHLGELSTRQMTFQKKNGELFTVELNATVINKNGKREYILVTWIDITERKKAEQALQESEEKFRNLFEHARETVILTDADTGIVVDINHAGCTMLGLPKEKIIGRHMTMLHPPEMAEQYKQLFHKHVVKGVVESEDTIIQRADGTRIPADMSASVIKLADKTIIQGVFRDITERKKAEEALQDSEEKFSKAFNSSANAICISSLPDNKFIEINDSYCRFTGYTHEEVIGHTSAELNLWVMDDEYQKLVTMLTRDGIFRNMEFHSRMKSGEIRTGLGSAENVNIGGKQCRIVAITDITERKKAERALVESEEKFSKAFNASTNAFCITSLKDNRFMEINESFTRFTGYNREEVIGHAAGELNLWVKPDEWQRWMDTLQKDNRVFNQEFSSRMKSGEIRVGLSSAEVINIGGELCRIVVITDITERKKAEEALRMSEENFRHTLDDSPLGIRIVNTSGKTIHVNKALLNIYGYANLEELMSISAEKRFTPESYKKHLMLMQKMLQGELLPRLGETSIIRKNGEIRNLEIMRKEVLWNGEKLSQLLYLDITERQQAEKDLKQALANLEQSNTRLAASNSELEAFSYSVSHDLRSPLRSIDGFSQALLEDYADKLDGTARDYLKRLRNASQKMGELIDGLLRLSRLSRNELHKENVNLSALADEIATRLRETNPERKAEFIIGRGLTANGDPQLLRALLENLLGNAWKFTGKVPLARIEFGAIQKDGTETFFVKDNGAGFDMTYVDKLFGAFQRLHDTAEFPGTGIGLATVRRIINRHGGNVRAEGEVDKGAVFYFTLD